VQHDENDGGSNDPKHSGAGTCNDKYRYGCQTNAGVLLRERHFLAHKFDLPLFVLQLEDVTRSKRGSDAEQQHGRREKAIGDEDGKDVNVIALEVINVPR